MKIVVLGGGNGTSRLLRALLPLLKEKSVESLHALVSTADDGGSTGQLRVQYGVNAMGDITKSLIALSKFNGDPRREELLKVLEYRFDKETFKGHTLRNILLLVSELYTKNIDSAIAIFTRFVPIHENSGVIPTTLKPLRQKVEIKINGKTKILGQGQFEISHNKRVEGRPGEARVTFEKNEPLNPRAKQVLSEATHIIVAPGHTYGTILPALALPELGEAIKDSKAKIWVVMTLLTTPGQTQDWTGEDFVSVYKSYLGRPVDLVVANTSYLDILLRAQGQSWVKFDKECVHAYKLEEAELAVAEDPTYRPADVVPRAIVVHDSKKLEKLFRELL